MYNTNKKINLKPIHLQVTNSKKKQSDICFFDLSNHFTHKSSLRKALSINII